MVPSYATLSYLPVTRLDRSQRIENAEILELWDCFSCATVAYTETVSFIEYSILLLVVMRGGLRIHIHNKPVH